MPLHWLLISLSLFWLAGTKTANKTATASVDVHVASAWAHDKIQPAIPADDWEFVRRVYLDLIGRIPTTEEAGRFVAGADSRKRSTLIDKLIASGEFDGHWRENLHVHLTGGAAFAGDAEWRNWLRESLKQNKKWDELAREVLNARDEKPEQRGASHFLLSRLAQGDGGVDLITRDVSRIFFGVDIQCARCHKHPEVAQWKQESYWGMAAFFSRSYPVAVKGRTYLAERAAGEIEYTPKGKAKRYARPRFLTGEELPAPIPEAPPAQPVAVVENPADYLVPPETAKEKTRVPAPKASRRSKFIEIAIQSKNPFFKRAAVNYVWSQLMGHGLVEPIDQMHEANPGSHPELLNAVADDFAAHGFDIRHLIRSIANSRPYQLASRYPEGTPRPDPASHACANLRPLSPHQLAMSMLIAAGYGEDGKPGSADERRSRLEKKQGKVLTFLVNNLGTGNVFQPTVAQALLQTNGGEYADILHNGGAAARITAIPDDARLAQELFLRVFSRPATPDEVHRVSEYLAVRPGRRAAACEQLLWAAICSAEFRFNH